MHALTTRWRLRSRGYHLRAMGFLLLLPAQHFLSVANASEPTADQQFIVSIERIWDRAGHSAFTDLIAWHDHLYCAFREGSGHIPGLNGVIRVLRSADGEHWTSVARLEEAGYDLRDPKLSVTPDDRLMIAMGASLYHGSERLAIESRVAFLALDAANPTPPTKVIFPSEVLTGFDWLWRVTWHDRSAWGCLQQVPREARKLRLVKSADGVHYEQVAELPVDAPSETTLRFEADGTLIAMIRRGGADPRGAIGMARPPYSDWQIRLSNKQLGGPDFVELAPGRWLAGSRSYDTKPHQTQLWWFDPRAAAFANLLTLPSGGDNSYPGFVVDEARRRVYVSYYSSHEGNSAIYLATLRLDALLASPAQ